MATREIKEMAALDYEEYFEEHPEERIAKVKKALVIFDSGDAGKKVVSFATIEEREVFIKEYRKKHPTTIIARDIIWA